MDCVAVADDVRLVFVKNHFGLASSNRSYRYVGSCGVDVWNLSTGTCRPVMPFDKYGRLLQVQLKGSIRFNCWVCLRDQFWITVPNAVMMFNTVAEISRFFASRLFFF